MGLNATDKAGKSEYVIKQITCPLSKSYRINCIVPTVTDVRRSSIKVYFFLTMQNLQHILHSDRCPIWGGGFGAAVFLFELTEDRQVWLHNSFTVPESSTGARMMLWGRNITLRERDQGEIGRLKTECNDQAIFKRTLQRQDTNVQADQLFFLVNLHLLCSVEQHYYKHFGIFFYKISGNSEKKRNPNCLFCPINNPKPAVDFLFMIT